MIAFFLKMALGGLNILKAIGQWLSRRSLIELACIALAISTVVFGCMWKSERVRANGLENKLQVERAARVADRLAYTDAQRKAHEANEAEVKRIETEQESINAEAKSRYERDLARLRAGGLRKDLAAPKGAAGCAPSGADGKAAAGVDEQNVCVPRSLLVRAAEIELGRNALIDWINEQLGVKR